ncbi:hypothetical protein G7K_2066-t1 [Saitoella complicata NRRL Y-17804]|uniref:Secreted protein n=1 Tax=Saitoella complicata (strain BCRC 22490 / CBS 7301 / JCM 7358 / NBRC 10748 / NRRL Y-17804) TaxID=698492 RepID=A0A0E9NEQ8_SAICN|nr:hypothetical protein G7K_2066-t1 [Saitoella complicata NRRL Y-17804]
MISILILYFGAFGRLLLVGCSSGYRVCVCVCVSWRRRLLVQEWEERGKRGVGVVRGCGIPIAFDDDGRACVDLGYENICPSFCLSIVYRSSSGTS